MDEVFHIKGQLTVAITQGIPIARQGCCGAFDPLRKWMSEKHPFNPAQKIILFYTRGGLNNHKLGRAIGEYDEKEVLNHIRAAMTKYNRPEELVIFNGQENGVTMSFENQFKLFRSASSIIGPHGSGFGGNFAWTNPFPTNCEEKVKLLEFIPGQDSATVQKLYVSYVSPSWDISLSFLAFAATHSFVLLLQFLMFRKWPFDHHVLLYTKDSNRRKTYIDLQALDDALDSMWGVAGVGTS